ncbi:MAG: hypothetical protein IJG19_06485 [Methanobrevibacter sp.]|nr:hypothetical protein [Methanobrevibacter sp.]
MDESNYMLTKKGLFPIKEQEKYAGKAGEYKIHVETSDRDFLNFIDDRLDELISEYKVSLRKK